MTAHTAFADPRPVKLTVDDFEALERAGAFRSYHKVELIDGELVAMNAQLTTHSWAKNEVGDRLREALRLLGSPLKVQIEVSLHLSNQLMPDPDIVITSDPRAARFITPAATALVVEVADSSLNYDLGRKRQFYASAGVNEYWVVDLVNRRLHQFAEPKDGMWSRSTEVEFGSTATSLTLTNLSIETHDLI